MSKKHTKKDYKKYMRINGERIKDIESGIASLARFKAVQDLTYEEWKAWQKGKSEFNPNDVEQPDTFCVGEGGVYPVSKMDLFLEIAAKFNMEPYEYDLSRDHDRSEYGIELSRRVMDEDEDRLGYGKKISVSFMFQDGEPDEIQVWETPIIPKEAEESKRLA